MNNLYHININNSCYGDNPNFYGMFENYNKPCNKRELFKLLKEQKLFNKFCLVLANITQGKYNIIVNENETKQVFTFLNPKTQLNSFIETILYHTKHNDLNYVRKIINTFCYYQLKAKIT